MFPCSGGKNIPYDAIAASHTWHARSSKYTSAFRRAYELLYLTPLRCTRSVGILLPTYRLSLKDQVRNLDLMARMCRRAAHWQAGHLLSFLPRKHYVGLCRYLSILETSTTSSAASILFRFCFIAQLTRRLRYKFFLLYCLHLQFFMAL